MKPSRILEPALVSTPSTQSTSLYAKGMPQSGPARSGDSASMRAARPACRSVRASV